jgi:hypothetical protein
MTEEKQKIKGYRNLTEEEVSAINEIKDIGEKLGNLIEKLESIETTDTWWLTVGKTDLQKGLMAITRSVAKPNSF